MPLAHLYIFSDACPTDWLIDGHDEDWHTIVNLVFQSDPALQQLVDHGESHEVVLAQDSKYTSLVQDIQTQLPHGLLQKWRPKHGRAKFCRAFMVAQPKHQPMVSACSFQEKTLRDSKTALLSSYNQRIGGIEGRSIGFDEYFDHKSRHQMKHSFVNFQGLHNIQAPANQMLILLLMSWFIADQYSFYSNHIVRSGRYGFDGLGITVVSDKLSGDDSSQKRESESNLRQLIDPENEGVPVALTRSPKSDTFSGDLLVDNLAGWLNAAMTNPAGDFADYARQLVSTNVWTGWHCLVPSNDKLTAIPAVTRLAGNNGACHVSDPNMLN